MGFRNKTLGNRTGLCVFVCLVVHKPESICVSVCVCAGGSGGHLLNDRHFSPSDFGKKS